MYSRLIAIQKLRNFSRLPCYMSKLSSRTALIPVFALGVGLPVQASECTVVSAAAYLSHSVEIAFSLDIEAV
jgi:hypothetical protein